MSMHFQPHEDLGEKHSRHKGQTRAKVHRSLALVHPGNKKKVTRDWGTVCQGTRGMW